MTNEELRGVIERAWACAYGGTKISYLSGPISTGHRYVRYLRSKTYRSLAEVIEWNRAELSGTAMRLRQTLGIVMEPGGLAVESFTHEDYMLLWEKLLERSVSRVLFLPQWEYSKGCAMEYLRAKTLGIPTNTIDGKMIDDDQGLFLIRAANLDIAQSSHPDLLKLSTELLAVENKLVALR